jgi:Asp/Glu/hydantoin racemase
MRPGAGMITILLLNPNTSARSLDMMLAVAVEVLPPGIAIKGISAAHGVQMIVNEAELRASAAEVIRLGSRAAPDVSAIIVAAFGDPGVVALRNLVDVPVIGIGEASITEAASGGRRFGIATTTPALTRAIEDFVDQMALRHQFTGVRFPNGDPLDLAANAQRQQAALAQLAEDCFELDGAEAVVIGGGPLSEAARAVRDRFGNRIIEPVPSAIRYVTRLLGLATTG